jgi:transcriptional regulator with XRE-family HTH domain
MMGETELRRHIHRRQAAFRRALADELRRVVETEGLSLRAIAGAAGVDSSQLSRVLRGSGGISHDALVAAAAAMGHDVSLRLFESTGPRVRDRVQARLIEAFLATAHRRWFPRLEVAVYRPVRGVIDLVLQDQETWDAVAGEGHSQLRSVEEQMRRAGEKADSLPSATGFPWSREPVTPRIGRLLLLRSSSANHELVRTLPATFRAAYPDSTEAAVDALRTGSRPWPGSAIVWVHVDGVATRVLDGTPRAVRLGR